jgi:hypothetical protein
MNTNRWAIEPFPADEDGRGVPVGIGDAGAGQVGVAVAVGALVGRGVAPTGVGVAVNGSVSSPQPTTNSATKSNNVLRKMLRLFLCGIPALQHDEYQ